MSAAKASAPGEKIFGRGERIRTSDANATLPGSISFADGLHAAQCGDSMEAHGALVSVPQAIGCRPAQVMRGHLSQASQTLQGKQ